MRKTVNIANKIIGDGHPCFITAEIGINHNGSVKEQNHLLIWQHLLVVML